MTLTSTEIGYSLLILVGFLIGFILFMRHYFNKNTTQLIMNKVSASIKIKKHSKVDILKFQTTNWLFGLACSLALVVLLLSYSKPEGMIDEDLIDRENIDDIEIDIPRTITLVAPPPIPPLPVIEELPEENIEFSSIETDTIKPDTVVIKEKKITDPLAQGEEEEEIIEEVFTRVEQMPVFPGCEDLETEKERKKCTETNLLKFMYKNLKYPRIARENGIQGPTVVEFTIGKDGSVINIELIKDPGSGWGEEVLRVISSMNEQLPKWKPGYQRNQPVKVKYMMPLRIRLH